MSPHPDDHPHEFSEAEARAAEQSQNQKPAYPPSSALANSAIAEMRLRIERLEPNLAYLDRSIAMASIAVSLKRIADIGEAIEREIVNANAQDASGRTCLERIADALDEMLHRNAPGGLGR